MFTTRTSRLAFVLFSLQLFVLYTNSTLLLFNCSILLFCPLLIVVTPSMFFLSNLGRLIGEVGQGSEARSADAPKVEAMAYSQANHHAPL